MIAKDVILSAAHCQGGQYKAVLGRHDLENHDGQEIGMKREVPTTSSKYRLLNHLTSLCSHHMLFTLNYIEL